MSDSGKVIKFPLKSELKSMPLTLNYALKYDVYDECQYYEEFSRIFGTINMIIRGANFYQIQYSPKYLIQVMNDANSIYKRICNDPDNAKVLTESEIREYQFLIKKLEIIMEVMSNESEC